MDTNNNSLLTNPRSESIKQQFRIKIEEKFSILLGLQEIE